MSWPVAKALIGWKPVNKHIITVHFQTRHAKVTITPARAPTMEEADNKKDNFYKILQNPIDEISRHDIKFLMGDFNAQIDISCQGMESTIGSHVSANINYSGERFILFYNLNDISIVNTFFIYKDIHKTTWLSPDHHPKIEIDYISISTR